MRTYILKGFLPWILFFAFVDGTVVGLGVGIFAALIGLALFNRKALKKKFILDWAGMLFFVALLVLGVGFQFSFVTRYGLFLANVVLTAVCYGTLIINIPFTLQYAREELPEHYRKNPILIGVNRWLTFFWGTCFLVSSISTALYYFGGQPNLLWMIKIIPTAMLVLAILLTIVFPDLYKARRMRKGGVSSIAGISEVKKVALGNVTIGYRTLGKGPLLILLNGSHMNMHHWSPEFLKRLSAYYQVLIFDYPGIGHSSYENMPFTAEKIATCLKRFIEKLNLTPFVMVGYSMGGKIAQVFANHYPKHLRALVLIGTDFGGPKIIQCGEHAREVVTSIGEDVTELQAYLPLFFPESVLPRVEHKMEQIVLSASLEGAPSKEMLEKEGELSARFSADDSNRKALNHLLVPTLIVSGALDELIPTENASLLSETISGAHLMEYPDAGHGVVYQYPLEVADYIHNFLSTMQQY